MASRADAGAVVAPLNYLAPMAQAARTYTYDPPDGTPRFNGRLQAHRMTIRDARPLRDELQLEREGFVLRDHPSAVRDFWDEDLLRATHYAEVEALLRELTGARRVQVFDHTLRRRAPHRPPLDGAGGSFAAVREPVGRVHADYTDVSAPRRLRQLLGDGPDTERRVRERYVIYGLWRPLNAEPLQDAPLALADAQSIAPGDLVTNQLIYRDRIGETCIGLHNPAHRWYYFAHQRRDEVTIFKHFDSAAAQLGVARVAPHTAFEDPTTPTDAQPRASIEMRAFAFFGE